MVGVAQSSQSTSQSEIIPIPELDNDSLLMRLIFTTNFLSRWLTSIHDEVILTRSPRRSDPTVKSLLIELRDEELRTFPKVHQICVRTLPDLDKLPPFRRTLEELAWDEQALPLEIMAEFRRLRQSTTSHLRSLPDSAWSREGTSRREHDWTIRTLAEHLAEHDTVVLQAIDDALDRLGVRQSINAASRAHLPELLRLVPAARRRK